MQNSFCAREEKEHEGEDFYGTLRTSTTSRKCTARCALRQEFFSLGQLYIVNSSWSEVEVVKTYVKLLAVTRVTIVTRYLASVRVSLVYTRVTTYDELRNLVDVSARLVSFYIRPSRENKIF